MTRTGQNLVVLRVAGWLAGENGNKANSASVEVEVEVEAELGKKKASTDHSVTNPPCVTPQDCGLLSPGQILLTSHA